ncbi:hypothetical protein [Sphingorhabdus contaminans]|uniref:hypothetical protein n=1 Tax=Sphingorhabdus contaminans TaxID=1343899 RepID=UPI003D2B9AA2
MGDNPCWTNIIEALPAKYEQNILALSRHGAFVDSRNRGTKTRKAKAARPFLQNRYP